jgi:hypothetical protein
MKLKTLIVTVLVLAAISGAVYVLRRPAPPASADPRTKQPLVERSVVEKAAKLRLSDQGKTVLLARGNDGNWRVASYYDLPADFQKLSNFVSSLTESKIDRLVTTSADRISRLEFKDTKIELLDSADKELWSVTLGKTPELGGGRYVRYGTEQKAYLAALNAWIDPESKNWANTELLNLKADDIAKIEIPFAEGGPVTVSRAKKDDPWTADKTPAGQRVNTAKISALLGTLGNVRFSDTSDPGDPNAEAARKNQRAFKLTTFDNKTYTVALGRKPEEKRMKPVLPDNKSGPAALGSLTDMVKKDADEKKADAAKPGEESKPVEPKPLAPEVETIAAGPVYVFISASEPNAPVNALMQRRAFQLYEYAFTSLPQKPEELFEAAPAPAPPPPTPPAATEPKKQ